MLTANGLDSSDFRVRSRAILTVPRFLLLHPQVIRDTVPEFKYLLESLVIRTQDSAEYVAQCANAVLEELIDEYSQIPRVAFWLATQQRDDLLKIIAAHEKRKEELGTAKERDEVRDANKCKL